MQGFSHSGFETVSSFHKLFPTKPLFESECCSCNSQRGENVGTGSSVTHNADVQSSFNAECLAR